MNHAILILLNILIFYNCSISKKNISSPINKNQELERSVDYNSNIIFLKGNNEYCDSQSALINHRKIDSLLVLLNEKTAERNNPFSPPQILEVDVLCNDKITLIIEDSSKKVMFIKNLDSFKRSGKIILNSNHIRNYFVEIKKGIQLYFIIFKNNTEKYKGIVKFSYYSYWVCV